MGAVRLVVTELSDGGFVVCDQAPVPGVMDTPLFAASTLEDALVYLRTRFRCEREAMPEALKPDLSKPCGCSQVVLSQIGRNADLSMDTSDLVQHGRNAMADAVRRRGGHLPS